MLLSLRISVPSLCLGKVSFPEEDFIIKGHYEIHLWPQSAYILLCCCGERVLAQHELSSEGREEDYISLYCWLQSLWLSRVTSWEVLVLHPFLLTYQKKKRLSGMACFKRIIRHVFYSLFLLVHVIFLAYSIVLFKIEKIYCICLLSKCDLTAVCNLSFC